MSESENNFHTYLDFPSLHRQTLPAGSAAISSPESNSSNAIVIGDDYNDNDDPMAESESHAHHPDQQAAGAPDAPKPKRHPILIIVMVRTQHHSNRARRRAS